MSDLTIYKSNNVLTSYDDVSRAAEAMARSGYFKDATSAAQAVVKVLAGKEIGIGAFASMSGIHIVNGKPTIGANIIASQIKASGKYNYSVSELTEKVCEIVFYEAGKECGRSRFTIEEANRAGLTTKDVWKNYSKNMLFARAISNGAKWYTPDLFSGATVYTPEELGADVDGDGNIIDLHLHDAKDIPPQEPPKQTQPTNGNKTSIWRQELLESISKWTGKATGDIVAVLGLSHVLSTGDQDELITDWMSMYVNSRKEGIDSKAAVKQADDWLVSAKAKITEATL